MLGFYLACLVLGGALIAIPFFTGHNNGSDGINSNIENDHIPADSHPNGFDSSADYRTLISYTLSEIGRFFSFGNLSYFILFFGFTGFILTLLKGSALITSIFSTFSGLFGWWLGYKIMQFRLKYENSEGFNISALKNQTATVILPISKSRKGKIIANFGGISVEIPATLSDTSQLDELPQNSKALIINVEQNFVYVVESDN